MIIIHGWADFKPEAKAEVEALGKQLAAQSLTEPGNVHYGLAWDVNDANRICLIEIWEDKASHTTHTEQELTKQFGQLAAASVIAPPTFIRYEGEPLPK